MRLFRLREMQDYFTMIQESKSLLTEHLLDDNYNVFNFGSCAKPDAVTDVYKRQVQTDNRSLLLRRRYLQLEHLYQVQYDDIIRS